MRPDVGAASLSAPQAQNAAAIIAVADAGGLGNAGAVIGVMTALAESDLENLNYGDRDSLGLFQQRASQGWGTPAQEQDPTTAAAMFYARLKAVSGWLSLPPWVAAQTVQRSGSADGSNYHARYAEAQQIVGVTDANATNVGCGQQQGAVPAGPGGKVPAGYQIPADATPGETKAITFALSKVGGPYVWGVERSHRVRLLRAGDRGVGVRRGDHSSLVADGAVGGDRRVDPRPRRPRTGPRFR